MKRVALLLCLLTLCLGNFTYADEGMWLFNAFPKDKVQAKYGFAPDQAWLDHVRLSSARAPNGSSSFVSPDGLIFTNHHIAQECIHDLSTGGKDYMKDGFYAATRAEEAKCPGMEFVVLEDIEDVTAKVNGAVKPGMSTADAGKAQREEMGSLEKECSSNGMRCDVVTLYSGAMYNLYKYKKYDDIRLVFAPEFAIAFFGGDPDNFEYPRYDLDISFFRAYENGEPAKIHDYLKWSTDRRQSKAIWSLSPDIRAAPAVCSPWISWAFCATTSTRCSSTPTPAASTCCRSSARNRRRTNARRRAMSSACRTLSRPSPAIEAGLKDKELMAQKAADEKSLQQFVSSDPQRKQEFGDPWAADRQSGRRSEADLQAAVLPGRHWVASAAIWLAMPAISCAPPPKSRSPATSASADIRIRSCRRWSSGCSPPLPSTRSLEQVVLAESLAEMRDVLGADNPDVQKALAGKIAGRARQGTDRGHQAGRRRRSQAALRRRRRRRRRQHRSADRPDARRSSPMRAAIHNQDEDQVQSVLRRAAETLARRCSRRRA